jgi:hypothetical protein
LYVFKTHVGKVLVHALASVYVAHFAEGLGLPPVAHSRALMLPNSSALSRSSAAISSMMSCGLR